MRVTLLIVGVCAVCTLLVQGGFTRHRSVDAEDGITELAVPTNDIVYDSFTDMIYASVPGTADGIGNSITVIDPDTGTIGPSLFVGIDPGKLALSDDGQYLYVALDGEGAVRRLDLRSQDPEEFRFSLGTGPLNNPYFVEDMEVLPGNPYAVAISREIRGTSPRHAGVVIYEDGVKLPNQTPRHTGSNVIEFSGSASTLYGFNNETTEFGFRTMWVDDSGVITASVSSGLLSGFGVDIEFDGGLIYATSGEVLNPTRLEIVGAFPASGIVEPDSSLRRTFFLQSGRDAYVLRAFDLATFSEAGSLEVPEVSGRPTGLIRWGENGLAFSTSGDQVFIIQTSLVSHGPPVPPPEEDQVMRLALPTNDIVYDSFTEKFYASVPSRVGGIGNTITVIDPVTGELGPSVFVGRDPGKLALSDDGQYLYVGLDGEAAVRRFDLASQSPGLKFSLGSDPFHGPYYVEDMEVLPGNPNAVAISRKNLGTSPRHAGVAIYQNGVKLPSETARHTGSNVIEFSGSASTLYGYNNESTEYGFRRMSIDGSGVSVAAVSQDMIVGSGVDIEFDGGLIYATSGRVLDPDTLTLLGTFPVSDPYPAALPVEPDSVLGRTFFLASSESNRTTYELVAFDQTTFTSVGSLQIDSVSGGATSLIRWGDDGLAFRTNGGQVFIIRTSLVTDPPEPSPAPSPMPVNDEVVQIQLPANDIIYDPSTQKIFASIPARFGATGNSVAAIDPDTGLMTEPTFVGSEPGKLALSDDSQYLYVALDGAGAVRRFDVPSLTAELQFWLGNHPNSGPYFVDDIEVLPGDPGAVAVARKNLYTSPRHAGVAIYDEGLKLPTVALGHTGSNVIAFSASASTLYGQNNETTGFAFYRMKVDASGVSVIDTTRHLVSRTRAIEFQDGLIYTTSGWVIDPEIPNVVGTFSANGPVEPDSKMGRTFFLTRNGFGGFYELLAFDQSTFELLGSLRIPGVSGTPTSLIRWGDLGLAFRTGDQVFIVRPRDSDGDAFADFFDSCPGTAAGATVDEKGCSQVQVDQDLDGFCDPGKTSTLCMGTDACPLEAPIGGLDANRDGCTDTLEGLIKIVETTAPEPKIVKGLLGKLMAAQRSLDRGDRRAAANEITAFIHQVEAHGGKTLSAEDAGLLVTYGGNVISLL